MNIAIWNEDNRKAGSSAEWLLRQTPDQTVTVYKGTFTQLAKKAAELDAAAIGQNGARAYFLTRSAQSIREAIRVTEKEVS